MPSDNLFRATTIQSALITRTWLDPDAAASSDIFQQMIDDVVSNRSRISNVARRRRALLQSISMKFLQSATILLLWILLLPSFLFASSHTAPTSSARIEDPLAGGGITSIVGFFQAILDVILIFAVPVVVFFIIYAGFNYVTARGNAEKISQAHKALLYAIIGGVIVLGANVILDVIANTVCDVVGDGGPNSTVCDTISN